MKRRRWLGLARGTFRLRRIGRLCALTALSALLVAGMAVAAVRTVIRSGQNATYGRILAGPAGFTLYVFCAGTQTRCTGHRAKGWSPLIARGRVTPAKGSRIQARRLGTRKLTSGKRQVTYYGQPLYLYAGDRRRGQTSGEDRAQGNGAWFVISNSGSPVPPSVY